jgi:hypothetical protein
MTWIGQRATEPGANAGQTHQIYPKCFAVVGRILTQMRQIPDAMTGRDPTTLSASGQQQLEALEKLRQQGLITPEAYESARKQIFDSFSAG